MILLTGASGFIGKHLHTALINEYGSDNIVAFTSKPTSSGKYLLHQDYNFDNNYFIESGYGQINTIVHAGAFIPKKSADANDWRKCNSNIHSTSKLLEADLPELKKVIYLSTVDVYGKTDIIAENTNIDPPSLYGDSKFYGEKMIQAWATETRSLCQILRIGHVYGAGEEAYQKVIPLTMRKLLNDAPIEIWGTGNEIRSFIYIDDVIACILKAVKLAEFIGPVNLASSNQISIKDLVNKLVKLSGKKVNLISKQLNTPGRDLLFDNGKMKDLLLQSEMNFDDGLQIEWDHMRQVV